MGSPPRPRRLGGAAVALALAAAWPPAGCGEGGRAGGAAASRTDSAGIEIVTSAGPEWPGGRGWALTDDPLVRVGTLEGAPEAQLFGVRDAALLGDGRIVVANAGTHELRLFGPDGAFLRALGGEGEGPGEFRDLRAISVGEADSIFAWDVGNRRVSVFTPEDGFARSFGLDPPSEGAFPLYRGRFGDGSLLVTAAEVLVEPPADGVLLRGTIEYLRYAPDGTPSGTVAELPNRPSLVRTRTEGGRVMGISFWSAPLEIGHAWALGEDAFYAGTGETYEIRVYGPDGTLRRLVRRDVEPPRVRELGGALVEEELAETEDPERRREQAEAYDRIPAPERVPAFDELLAGSGGRLWVRRFRRPGEEGRRWDVFAPDGRWLGTVRTPAGLQVYRVGPARLLGRSRDELDVERVELYGLREITPSP